MYSNYLIVKIKNSAKDFSETWKKIENLKDINNICQNEYSNFYFYAATEKVGGNGKLIQNIGIKLSRLEQPTLEQLLEKNGICLWIEDCVENDTIEYEYLALMLQNMEHVICYIYPDNTERVYEVYRNVSCYFSYFIRKHNRRERVWIERVKADEIGIEMLGVVNNIYRITPIIEFEQGEKGGHDEKGQSSLQNWTRTVAEFLCQENINEICKIETFQEVYYRLSQAKNNLKNAEVKNNLEKIEKYKQEIRIWQNKRDKLNEWSKNNDIWLLCRCINYFSATPNSKSINQIQYYRELFWSEEIQEMIKGISILTLYMLCIQLYFMKETNRLSSEEIKLMLVNVGELTEGVVQLLENLHHSTLKRGLLSIRIHEKKDHADYWHKKYQKYYSKNHARFTYEFRILDYSKQSIVENFRIKQENQNVSVPQTLGIRSFFEYTEGAEFWEEYNKNPQNLVHHYGLQIFATIISNNGGYFGVISSSKQSVDEKRECYANQEWQTLERETHIPGTEYVVLLPMVMDAVPINPSVDADIQYKFDLKKKYYISLYDINSDFQKIDSLLNEKLGEQERKEASINQLKDKLLRHLQEKEVEQEDEIVLLLSIRDWGERKTEIFCKAIIMCLIEWNPQNKQGFYAIIQECTSNDFITITRMFAIFYGKYGLNTYMERIQIYLSGVDQSEEFLIAGSNISALLTMARKLTLVRGIQPHCMKAIEYILNKFCMRFEQDKHEAELELVPFDMLELTSSDTLFEKAVKRVLESDLQRYSFGCKLKHTHMRIGSKLHINEFYEAELLFHNNYYVARFALLVIRRLEKKLNKDTTIIFVGYETYSELLLYEIVTNLREKGYDCSYMVYEQRKEGKFRYYDSLQYIKERKSLEFVLIVPLNSSMTTHSKLRASLELEIKKVKASMQMNIIANYALILIRSSKEDEDCDEMELRYCKSMKNGIIEALYLPEGEQEIQYFVCVNTKWEHPLRCPLCFPQKSMLDEQPLIETNRASIIPDQMLGIQEPNIFDVSLNRFEKEKNQQLETINSENFVRVEQLRDNLVYRHIVRMGKHFMFYFELEKYFMQNRKDIIEWLQGLKTKQRKGDGIVYDVIVAPLHFSNAGFVAEVNYHLYGNAALVLNFEVEKEFRANVKTKYSNIIGLYKKLLDMGKEAELRFHFVDDNIISGNTYFRAKSLFSSLLPNAHKEKVKVSVFEDIIVILNRMSDSSIMNFVDDKKNYHAYVSLNISSMRNHEDACTLCKIVENSEKLRDCSSTNEMYKLWDMKMVHHGIVEAENYQNEVNSDQSEELKERAYKRMLCTHIINERLSKLGYQKNDEQKVENIILDILNECTDTEEPMEWIISYIKVLSRPFVSFRKSNREAIFHVMLELLEFIVTELVNSNASLNRTRFSKYGKLKDICNTIRDAKTMWGQDEKIYSLILTLMQRLSALGSNYIIRKENIKKLFNIVDALNIPDVKRKEFRKRYLAIAKRITSLSSDESKCIYLEYLILYGEEYSDEETEIKKWNQKLARCFELQEEKDFLEILFLENTRVLYDGIRDMANEITDNVNEVELLNLFSTKYYYENFCRLLRYYHFIKEENDKLQFTNQNGRKLITLINLYRMLLERENPNSERDVEAFYNDLLEYVEIITGAKTAKLLFLYDITPNSTSDKKKVYIKQRGVEIGLEEVDFKNAEFKYDTYTILEGEDKMVLIKYRNYVGKKYSAKDKNRMNDVYMELTFDSKISDLDTMIALKCITVFRNLIVENLEMDFSNNLMQKWSAEQTFSKNMKLERATDHTDKDDLAEILSKISKGMGEGAVEYQRDLFYLVINSYIARFNVQILANALPEGENESNKFEFVYKHQLGALIETMHAIEKFDIIDENQEKHFSRKVLMSRIRMYKDERRWERLSVRRLSIIIVELIHSAIKYSDSNSNGNKQVYIYREDNYLVVKNSFKSDKSIEVIKKEAKDAYSRKKEGISLAVIKELVDKFYCLDDENGVIIDAEEINSKKYYFVKLPILED